MGWTNLFVDMIDYFKPLLILVTAIVMFYLVWKTKGDIFSGRSKFEQL